MAIVAGLIVALPVAIVGWVLVVLGLVVGFLNIGDKDATPFLIATIALMTVGAAGLAAVPTVGMFIGNMLTNIVAFVAPAALVVGLKEVYQLASL
ncbi:hypothetical protein HQ529_01310 [Candidatus Woesearchaeota archaeon]|nr:hypothetical protein [Candidatus Woesearchaeota archaeon]